jgi:hypothetical protein
VAKQRNGRGLIGAGFAILAYAISWVIGRSLRLAWDISKISLGLKSHKKIRRRR